MGSEKLFKDADTCASRASVADSNARPTSAPSVTSTSSAARCLILPIRLAAMAGEVAVVCKSEDIVSSKRGRDVETGHRCWSFVGVSRGGKVVGFCLFLLGMTRGRLIFVFKYLEYDIPRGFQEKCIRLIRTVVVQ